MRMVDMTTSVNNGKHRNMEDRLMTNKTGKYYCGNEDQGLNTCMKNDKSHI